MQKCQFSLAASLQKKCFVSLKHFKSVYKSFNISRTLLIKGGFRCALNRFILPASTIQAILMFLFQKEEEKAEKDLMS